MKKDNWVMISKSEIQIKSKQRISDHGEVYTNRRDVNSMLNLVKEETDRIESRFLEPACGSGNFLIEILYRKMQKIKLKYRKSKEEYIKNSIIAISSIYGVDILEDNILECRENLFSKLLECYKTDLKEIPSSKVQKVTQYILSKNIIHGDALTMLSVTQPSKPITFTEWTYISNSKVKRRDYTLSELLATAPFDEPTIFSDLDEEVFVPKPVRVYPLIHYMQIGDKDD